MYLQWQKIRLPRCVFSYLFCNNLGGVLQKLFYFKFSTNFLFPPFGSYVQMYLTRHHNGMFSIAVACKIEVFIVVLLRSPVFWDVMLCHWVIWLPTVLNDCNASLQGQAVQEEWLGLLFWWKWRHYNHLKCQEPLSQRQHYFISNPHLVGLETSVTRLLSLRFFPLGKHWHSTLEYAMTASIFFPSHHHKSNQWKHTLVLLMDVSVTYKLGCFQVICIANSNCKKRDSVVGRAVSSEAQCAGTGGHYSTTDTLAATAQ